MTTKQDMEDLVNLGLAKSKTDLRGYTIYKYHPKVFYDNLWSRDERLLECRGIVFDQAGNIVQRPLKKVFNVRENGVDVPKRGKFTPVRKVNGFMACASFHNRGLVVSTTGSLESDYKQLAEKIILNNLNLDYLRKLSRYTFIFEIVDPSDPHIVHEELGVYLLGIRNKRYGYLLNIKHLKRIARKINAKLPEIKKPVDKHQFTDLVKNSNHEGYVVWNKAGNEILTKAKTPHYLSKKALMRLGKKNIQKMYGNPDVFKKMLDEEFYELYDWILNNFSQSYYLGIGEQGRKKLIENYFSKD